MRKWIVWVHMYGLLLCSSYLLLFGVSSLLFNHPLSFTKPEPTVVQWEQSVQVEAPADNVKYAEAVAGKLGLMGWVVPWQTRRDKDGTLHFGMARPGKNYTVHLPADPSVARVEERRMGLWAVLRSLHGLMEVPGSGLAWVWAQYTRLCTVLVLLAAVSGVYLFAARKGERLAGWGMLAGATAVSAAMMAYITFAG